jgi:hypothetical protein
VRRESFPDDHVGQRQRAGKALLGEQSLRRDTTLRATPFIDATLHHDLASIREANPDYLGELRYTEENLDRLGSEIGAAPPVDPGR